MKGFIVSTGYDANGGFYTTEDWPSEGNRPALMTDTYIPYPEETQNRLRKLTMLEVNWKLRLKFLFNPLKNETT